MQSFGGAHGFPCILNGQNRCERLDLGATHVDDKREVVSVPVSLDLEACKVGMAAAEG